MSASALLLPRLFALLIVSILAGCSGGGGDNSATGGPGGAATTNPQLSTTSALPSQIVAITDPSIHAGDTVEVTLSVVEDSLHPTSSVGNRSIVIEGDADLVIVPVDPDAGTGTNSGADTGSESSADTGATAEPETMTATTIAAVDGQVELMVPPLFDSAGDFRAGRLRIAVDGRVADQTLNIDPVPDLGVDTNGLLLLLLFENTLADYRAALANIDTIDADAGAVTGASAARQALQQGIDQVEAMRTELSSTGALTVETDQGFETLEATELSRVDRWILLSLLSTQALADAPAAPAAKASRYASGSGWRFGAGFGDQGTKAWIRQNWEEAKRAFARELSRPGQPVDPMQRSVYSGIETWFSDRISGAKRGLSWGVKFVGGTLTAAVAVASGWAYFAADTALAGVARSVSVGKAMYLAILRAADAFANQINTDAFLKRDGGKFDATAEFISQFARASAAALAQMAPSPWNRVFKAASWGAAIKDFMTKAHIDLCAQVSSVFCGSTSGGGSSSGGNSGPFTVIAFINFDRSTGSDPGDADIQITGGLSSPVISWNGNGIGLTVVDSSGTLTYGIAGELAGDVTPFGSAVFYGDYTLAKTTPEGPQPALALQAGVTFYVIDVQRLEDNQHAQLWIRVNGEPTGSLCPGSVQNSLGLPMTRDGERTLSDTSIVCDYRNESTVLSIKISYSSRDFPIGGDDRAGCRNPDPDGVYFLRIGGDDAAWSTLRTISVQTTRNLLNPDTAEVTYTEILNRAVAAGLGVPCS